MDETKKGTDCRVKPENYVIYRGTIGVMHFLPPTAGTVRTDGVRRTWLPRAFRQVRLGHGRGRGTQVRPAVLVALQAAGPKGSTKREIDWRPPDWIIAEASQ